MIYKSFDERATAIMRDAGIKTVDARAMAALMSCSSETARACLKRLERAGFLTVERRQVRGWQRARPGSGKSPITYKTRLEYRIVMRALCCQPVPIETGAALLA